MELREGYPRTVLLFNFYTGIRSGRSSHVLLHCLLRPVPLPPGFGRSRDFGFGRCAEFSPSSRRRGTSGFTTKHSPELRLQSFNHFPDCDRTFELFN